MSEQKKRKEEKRRRERSSSRKIFLTVSDNNNRITLENNAAALCFYQLLELHYFGYSSVNSIMRYCTKKPLLKHLAFLANNLLKTHSVRTVALN